MLPPGLSPTYSCLGPAGPAQCMPCSPNRPAPSIRRRESSPMFRQPPRMRRRICGWDRETGTGDHAGQRHTLVGSVERSGRRQRLLDAVGRTPTRPSPPDTQRIEHRCPGRLTAGTDTPRASRTGDIFPRFRCHRKLGGQRDRAANGEVTAPATPSSAAARPSVSAWGGISTRPHRGDERSTANGSNSVNMIDFRIQDLQLGTRAAPRS